MYCSFKIELYDSIDPEKREIYNRGGEEAVKQDEQRFVKIINSTGLYCRIILSYDVTTIY